MAETLRQNVADKPDNISKYTLSYDLWYKKPWEDKSDFTKRLIQGKTTGIRKNDLVARPHSSLGVGAVGEQ